MKTIIITLLALLAVGCTPSENDQGESVKRFITRKIPANIDLYGFNERWDAYNGQYELLFFIKNRTGKTIDIPQVEGVIYTGAEKIEVTGGPGKELINLDSGIVSFSAILPTQKPDSIVFITDI